MILDDHITIQITDAITLMPEVQRPSELDDPTTSAILGRAMTPSMLEAQIAHRNLVANARVEHYVSWLEMQKLTVRYLLPDGVVVKYPNGHESSGEVADADAGSATGAIAVLLAREIMTYSLFTQPRVLVHHLQHAGVL